MARKKPLTPRKPRKPAGVQITAVLPQATFVMLEDRAASEERTLSQTVALLVRHALVAAPEKTRETA